MFKSINLPSNKLSKDVVIALPADGPSLGVADDKKLI